MLRAAISNNPYNWLYYNDLAFVLNKSRRFEEAISHLNKSLELNPDNLGSLFQLGESNMGIMEYEKAASIFTKIIELYPDSAVVRLVRQCHLQRGKALLYLNQKELACEDFRYSAEANVDAKKFFKNFCAAK